MALLFVVCAMLVILVVHYFSSENTKRFAAYLFFFFGLAGMVANNAAMIMSGRPIIEVVLMDLGAFLFAILFYAAIFALDKKRKAAPAIFT